MIDHPALDTTVTARTIRVQGVVQGVGFRPFVWRVATGLAVTGTVRNLGGTVEILAEGRPAALDRLCDALRNDAPPLAAVRSVEWSPAEPAGLDAFVIEASDGEALDHPQIPPDVTICAACRTELFDPADRRHGYAFVNCTDCGPRYTIIEALPYDRGRTSMRSFALCERCAREYEDPADRRFHAEPTACPACGPQLTLLSPGWRPLPGVPLDETARILLAGGIVALKGLGGYHLACDATCVEAVRELRQRKHRPDQPFAVMVRTVDDARELFRVSEAEAELLTSPTAPIVLVEDRGKLAPGVAPGHGRQGVMLPSTPLHHLVLDRVRLPLVMTSGNRTGEPIATTDDEARRSLARVADALLVHDRAIVARIDDSVARVWKDAPVLLRRARGFAPAPIALHPDVTPVLATGAELHATFCLAAGHHAYLSPHIGNVTTEAILDSYRATLAHYVKLLGIEPERVAHDLHPDFLTTRLAEATELPSVEVQHHHAHVAAVMAEHGLEGRVIGVAFDGFGLGTDGTAWGGEFLLCDDAGFERAGHLRQLTQPGGDAAVRDPSRMALAHAADAGVLPQALKLLHASAARAHVLLDAAAAGLNSPLTTSAGRLFDAVAALAGVCRSTTYDGQPAILLEQAASPSATYEYPFDLAVDPGGLILDTRPLMEGVVMDLTHGRDPGDVAGRFHRTMAAATLSACRVLRGQTGLDRVCLAGGVFNNGLLLSDLAARLSSVGFTVFVPHEVPIGDGGIALGQALVAHGMAGR